MQFDNAAAQLEMLSLLPEHIAASRTDEELAIKIEVRLSPEKLQTTRHLRAGSGLFSRRTSTNLDTPDAPTRILTSP